MLILLTGSTGFIGSRLEGKLTALGHDVHQLVRYVAGGRYNYYENERVHFADLRDSDSVKAVVLEVRPRVIIHLAAESAVSYSFSRPQEVISVNTLGTIALADAAHEATVWLFIHASTSEVYGNQSEFPIKETATLNATSPYAVSKIAAEEYLRVKAASDGLRTLIMRPFNSYGRALVGNRHFVVERAITQALETQAIKLHNPEPERDFLFREDHVEAYVKAVQVVEHRARHGGPDVLVGEAINIASGNCWTIREMAQMVAMMHNKRKPSSSVALHFTEVPDRPHDIARLHGDNAKAQELLGWKPLFSLSSGLSLAMDEWQQALATSPSTA